MPRLIPPHRLALLIATLATIGSGVASAGIVADGSRLYASCVVCHQSNAWGSTDGTIPNLAGQQRPYLERQMSLFHSGARIDTAMQIVATHPTFSSSQSITALATYLSGLDANPRPHEGAGDHLRLGQETFAHICAGCHGGNGQGDVANRVPRIGGQHYPYLRVQIDAAAEQHKDLAPPEMTSALRGMHSQEKDALADYVSRLGTLDLSPNPAHDRFGQH